MKRYPVPLVPGPTTVPEEILAAGHFDFGSGDMEAEFFDQYARVEEKLRSIIRTRHRIAIMSGEAMVVLWGALKSTLAPGDRVLSVATGVFGYGIAEMARTITAEVQVVGFEYDEAADPEKVSAAIAAFRPRMVTMVHVEAPSGVVNPVAAVGEAVRAHGVPLFYVDAVAGAGGAELATDDWGIDLCLLGSQKCFSPRRAWGWWPSASGPGPRSTGRATRDTTPWPRSGTPWRAAGFPTPPPGMPSPVWRRPATGSFPSGWIR